MPTARTIVLVHGLWHSSRIWVPWAEHLAALGHDAVGVDWPGERDGEVDVTRPLPGFAEIVAGVERVAAGVPGPVLVGVGAGALVNEAVADRVPLPGLVAIAELTLDQAVPMDPRGRPGQLFAAPDPPAWRSETAERWIDLDADEYAAYFGGMVTAVESAALWRRFAVPASGRLLAQLRAASLTRGPVRLETTRRCRRFPRLHVTVSPTATGVGAATTRSRVLDALTGSEWGPVEVVELLDRGQTLVFDARWPEVASLVGSWVSATC